MNDMVKSVQLIIDTIEDMERELLTLSIKLRKTRYELEEMVKRGYIYCQWVDFSKDYYAMLQKHAESKLIDDIDLDSN